jgi:hypothetical protein
MQLLNKTYNFLFDILGKKQRLRLKRINKIKILIDSKKF